MLNELGLFSTNPEARALCTIDSDYLHLHERYDKGETGDDVEVILDGIQHEMFFQIGLALAKRLR